MIAYASRHLSESEIKYSTVEKEALAIVYALDTFHCYLFQQQFTVWTDHNPLKWLLTMKKPKARIMRWLLHLQQFRFDVQYRPGKIHQNAGGLSRFPVDPAETVSRMEDVFVICTTNFVSDAWISAQAEDFCISVNTRLDDSTRFTHQNDHEKTESISIFRQ